MRACAGVRSSRVAMRAVRAHAQGGACTDKQQAAERSGPPSSEPAFARSAISARRSILTTPLSRPSARSIKTRKVLQRHPPHSSAYPPSPTATAVRISDFPFSALARAGEGCGQRREAAMDCGATVHRAGRSAAAASQVASGPLFPCCARYHAQLRQPLTARVRQATRTRAGEQPALHTRGRRAGSLSRTHLTRSTALRLTLRSTLPPFNSHSR